MTKFVTLVSGIPRMRDSTPVYSQYVTVGVGGVTSGTAVTLPASGTYTDVELLVFLNGQALEPVLDYNYVGTAPRTQVTFTFDLVQGDLVRFRIEKQ